METIESLGPRGNVISNKIPHIFERMLNDEWAFGIRMKSGLTYSSGSILGIYKCFGEFWMDINESQQDDGSCFSPPTSRKTVTINMSAIESLFETADT